MPFLDKPNAIIINIIKNDDNNEDWTTGQQDDSIPPNFTYYLPLMMVDQ